MRLLVNSSGLQTVTHDGYPSVQIPQTGMADRVLSAHHFSNLKTCAIQFTCEHDDRCCIIDSLWHGPHLIDDTTYYLVDTRGPAKPAIVAGLGGDAVSSLTSALQANTPHASAIRSHLSAMGCRPIRDPEGRSVSFAMPVALAGTNPSRLDDVDPDSIRPFDELEQEQ